MKRIGYNYDILISNRQNDEKYDGWITWFFDLDLLNI